MTEMCRGMMEGEYISIYVRFLTDQEAKQLQKVTLILHETVEMWKPLS